MPDGTAGIETASIRPCPSCGWVTYGPGDGVCQVCGAGLPVPAETRDAASAPWLRRAIHRQRSVLVSERVVPLLAEPARPNWTNDRRRGILGHRSRIASLVAGVVGLVTVAIYTMMPHHADLGPSLATPSPHGPEVPYAGVMSPEASAVATMPLASPSAAP
jgi:hypothetical protein